MTLLIPGKVACPNQHHTRHPACRGVTFMEVLVVVGVILLLLAMLFPSLNHAREQARRLLCQNNLKQWGAAGQFYRDDHNDYLPTEGSYLKPDEPYTWFNVLPPYLHAPPYREVEGVGREIREFPELHMWICPSKNLSPKYKSDSGMNQFHYAMNLVLDGVDGLTMYGDLKNKPILASAFPAQGNTVFMFDVYNNISCGSQKDVGTKYHRGIGNVLFLDGSVRVFRDDEFVLNGDFRQHVPIWHHPHLYWGYIPKTN